MFWKKKDESVQELIGFERFTQYGVMVRKHELLYFIVQPCNISVMSPENVSLKIIALTNILTAFPELQLSCTDANECFDSNKIHIRHLAEKERISSVRRQLELDSEELDHMQSETATARQFAFVYPLRDMKPEQVFQTANRIEKAIADQGFEVRRAGITDVKQMLAQYFNTAMNGGAVPDVDGGQHFKSKGGET